MRLYIAFALVTLALHATVATLDGKMVNIDDGDTITILDNDNKQHKIRLEGIDAPELGQAFGKASKEHLSKLLNDYGPTVYVDYDK